MQYDLDLIQRRYRDSVIEQRASDGYVNATAMCRAALKVFSGYSRLDTTQAFLKALSADVQIHTSELIQSVKGGDPHAQGTWVHPQVAIHLAQWLSPDFAVLVSRWVVEWMSGRGGSGRSRLPYHLQRYMDNRQNVPEDHFSILVEMTQAFLAPLEECGIELPESVLPDISQGKMFCAWLRDNGYDPDSFPTYRHVFSSGRKTIEPKAYPIDLLPQFRRFLYNEWMPKRMPDYVRQRIPEALPYLPRLLPKRRA